jgi:tRNA-Thr(GGU) m(6)t(6)A37 methyltransferase TsaA
MQFTLKPVAFVRSTRSAPGDDYWGGQQSSIELVPEIGAEALQGLDAFSHVEILFRFHKADPNKIVSGVRHPRNNPEWPRIGIFAQRGKDRPNHIGTTICRVVRVEGSSLIVAELDAIDGTPVVDIKPVMREFLPRQDVRQPDWCGELMQDYWLDTALRKG